MGKFILFIRDWAIDFNHPWWVNLILRITFLAWFALVIAVGQVFLVLAGLIGADSLLLAKFLNAIIG